MRFRKRFSDGVAKCVPFKLFIAFRRPYLLPFRPADADYLATRGSLWPSAAHGGLRGHPQARKGGRRCQSCGGGPRPQIAAKSSALVRQRSERGLLVLPVSETTFPSLSPCGLFSGSFQIESSF